MKTRHIVGVERGFGPRHAFNAQEGTEVVPETDAYGPGWQLGRALHSASQYIPEAVKWVADQVRQGILPDEALAEIQRNPASLHSMMAYADAAMSAGTLLSSGEGGKLPKGEAPLHPAANEIRKAVDSYDFKEQHGGHSELADDLGEIDNLPQPLEQALQDYHDAVTDDREQWGERSGEPELYGDRLYKLATQHAAPEQ